MSFYKYTGLEKTDTYKTLRSDGTLGGKVGYIHPGDVVELKDLIKAYQIVSGPQVGRFVKKLYAFKLEASAPPPPPDDEPDLPPVTDPVPAPLPEGLWIVRGDEELAEYLYQSRTASPTWQYLRQTPSVFRFDKFPVQRPTEYRVDITLQRNEIYRINNNRQAVDNYLFADAIALFNRTGFPKLQYLTMSFNLLRGVAIENGCLKFETLKPTSNTSGMTPASHPHFVHKFDLVTLRDGATVHVNTKWGDLFWFLTTNEGCGYIPLKWVRPYPYSEE